MKRMEEGGRSKNGLGLKGDEGGVDGGRRKRKGVRRSKM